MAIWQYQLFLLPKEEIKSYFKNDLFISEDDLNEIDWWKYSELKPMDFSVFSKILPQSKSWSDDITIYGNVDSDCIEVIVENNKIKEVSIRIDLRYSNKQLIADLCKFSEQYSCVFLNIYFKIINPIQELIEDDINQYPVYKSFINKLNK